MCKCMNTVWSGTKSEYVGKMYKYEYVPELHKLRMCAEAATIISICQSRTNKYKSVPKL